eukprot:TRINITY_DN1780_c2_g3_i1.p1 TRINITY_DN1780_c2_g3~~TRINITY_DN1780_c2_g3_i1.p1  ORF type:complete len:323 (+),score=103.73 TRINITY_DN1780_c2_g3_i1:61-969(+)
MARPLAPLQRRRLHHLVLLLLCVAVAHGVKLGGAKAVSSARGHRRAAVESSEEDDDDAADPAAASPVDKEMAEWIMQQASMYQTRVALLSVELDKKGYGLKGVIPQPPGLICAKSTKEHPLRCRVYMEPEEGSKVVAPCRCKGSQRWIAIRALNQQRRREPLKWSKCPTCQAHIDYSLYEAHMAGLDRVPTAVLNNRGAGRAALAAAIAAAVAAAALIFQGLIIRVVISKVVWGNWDRIQGVWGQSLPLYILGFQWLRKRAAAAFARLEEWVRGELTEVESAVMERTLPETVSAAEAEALAG